MRRCGFVTGAIYLRDQGEQPSLWQERAVLDETFFGVLRDHPVPISEIALRAIGPKSMPLDIYIWLAYRLHHLQKETRISWTALHRQFGFGFSRMRDFRRYFCGNLKLVHTVYPEALVSIDDDGRGITIGRSPAPVTKR